MIMEILHSQNAKDKIWSLVDEIKHAILTTHSEDNKGLNARPMIAQGRDFDGRLWFFTRDDSRKVKELNEDPNALLTYAHPSKQSYVTLNGKVTIMRDQQKIDELWNDMAKVWFPQGPDDPHITLIAFDPTKGEFWDTPGGTIESVWGYVQAMFTGEPPQDGQTGSAEFEIDDEDDNYIDEVPEEVPDDLDTDLDEDEKDLPHHVPFQDIPPREDDAYRPGAEPERF
jgi:general stress protein 26